MGSARQAQDRATHSTRAGVASRNRPQRWRTIESLHEPDAEAFQHHQLPGEHVVCSGQTVLLLVRDSLMVAINPPWCGVAAVCNQCVTNSEVRGIFTRRERPVRCLRPSYGREVLSSRWPDPTPSVRCDVSRHVVIAPSAIPQRNHHDRTTGPGRRDADRERRRPRHRSMRREHHSCGTRPLVQRESGGRCDSATPRDRRGAAVVNPTARAAAA